MKKVIIWGTSNTLTANKHLFSNMKILYYCNNEIKNEPQYLDGIRIINPDQIVDKIKEHPDLKIIIASLFEREIYRQCKSMGLGDYVELYYITRNMYYSYDNTDYIYYGGLYDDYYKEAHDAPHSAYKMEILPCNVLKKGVKRTIHIGKEQFFALKALEADTDIEVKTENDVYRKELDADHFEYFKKDINDQFTIKSNKDIVISKIWDSDKRDKGKLVLHIICDSLAQTVIENKEKEFIPNTYRYFQNGISFEDCYCCSDWTLPGVATIETGEYPVKHRLLHPNEKGHLKGQTLISSKFSETEEWYNVYIGSSWRADPCYGYAQGMDRTVYVYGYSNGGMIELFQNLMETVRTFRNKNLFITLHLYDLHHNMKLAPDIGEQIDLDLEHHFFVDEHTGKSVHANYNISKHEFYIQKLKKLDYYLGALYDFIEREYGSRCEVIFSADHGTTAPAELDSIHKLAGVDHRLADRMTKVPLYIKGSGIRKETIYDVTDNTVIYEILSRYLETDSVDNEMLYSICRKDFAYNESIYPGQSYVAEVIDANYRFYFETEDLVSDDCTIPEGNYKTRLFERKSGKETNNEKLKKNYTDIVLDHIGK